MSRRKDAAPLFALTAKAGAAAFARYGFSEQALFARWREIAGPQLGPMSLPVRLSFPRGERRGATLRLLAQGGAALELQHMAPQILERINSVFGYPAVAQLSIVQGPVEHPKAPPAPRSLSEDEEASLAALLQPVADEGLRKSLTRLGRALFQSTPHSG